MNVLADWQQVPDGQLLLGKLDGTTPEQTSVTTSTQAQLIAEGTHEAVTDK